MRWRHFHRKLKPPKMLGLLQAYCWLCNEKRGVQYIERGYRADWIPVCYDCERKVELSRKRADSGTIHPRQKWLF